MTADDVSDLIPSFDVRGMDLQLDRLQAALLELGSPCSDIPAIQIAGTNGKGSISCFVASALDETNIRSGVTISPHLKSWCERISINGEHISMQSLRERLISLDEISSRHQLTPFETLLTAAFIHFHANAVDLLVLEVGLGGRLDATSAHPKRPVIAMGSIGLDHCEHLGATLTAIAREKAAVITPGATVISASQHPDVAAVLERQCKDQHATLNWVDPLPPDWVLGLAGEIQRSNAAVARGALQALNKLGWEISDHWIRQGFQKAHWPGRLQTVDWKGHSIRLDGAHNPAAAQQLARERQLWPGQESGVCWIVGIQRNKNANAMLQVLLQPCDQVWIVPVPHHNSWTRQELLSHNPSWSNQIHQCCDATTALEQMDQQGLLGDSIPVMAGSLYLIGDLLQQEEIKAK
ncbi:MAG: dihydrofolate synthase [Cyanobium sp. NAT70]|nr:dihydrofolate synthase [Cyanobium sp. NAT70]|tara:strand:- start:896 stop:2119 length:1224 start_codon:yes stop_codon:yes gene_type:complete